MGGRSTQATLLEAEYEVEQQLGEGGQGVVRLCTHKLTGLRYACKSVPKSNDYDHWHVRREITSLARLTQAGPHPNVIHVQDIFEDSESVHIIMELCEGGDLFSHITDRASGRLSETHAAYAFSVIVQAVCFCHRHGIMHRDIKLENVLLARPIVGAHDYSNVIRLADFGASTNITYGSFHNDTHGTAFYMSPESLRTGKHDERVDVWSLGVLLYTLLCGHYPFEGDTDTDVFTAIKGCRISKLFAGAPWPSISKLAKDLIMCMLQREPARRIQLNRILSHPWLLRCPSSATALNKSQPQAALQSNYTILHAGLPCN